MSGNPPEVMDKLAMRIAELTLSSMGIHKQAELLTQETGSKVTHAMITRYKQRPAYKNYMVDAIEQIKKQSISDLVHRVSKLVPMIESTIVTNLENGNINAVPHALRILGLGEETKGQQAQQLNVIMPGARAPKETINIEVEDGEK